MLTPLLSRKVADAIAARRPVVALESTIFSNLGLPSPANQTALSRCVAAVLAGGAVPAVTAVLDGTVRVGVDESEWERILGPARKVAERDLGVAVAQRWEFGATTVSASLAIAAAAGVSVFATGGIGGVHRGAGTTFDVSADLDALATHAVVTVCAGAKAFLDMPATMEYLETRGVPVLGWRHDMFPAFYTRSSGVAVPHRAESGQEAAAAFRARARERVGMLVVAPIPEDAALDEATVEAAIDAALAAAERDGVSGAAVTPSILGHIVEASEGRSVPANLALAEHNAAVATEIAVALTSSG